MFCAILPLDFRSHLNLIYIFLENDQEHEKMSFFWAGDEIIFLSPFKTAVEKKTVFSNIYHRTSPFERLEFSLLQSKLAAFPGRCR